MRTFDAPEAMGINFHEVRARSALNHVPGGRYGFNWTINPYRGCTHACVFCFARRTHTYLDFDAGRDFEREIVVKVNVPELLRAELARPSWKRELVALGTNTDPYQWVESRYRMMPEILAALEEAETPVSVLTKSPLVLRDIDIFERMAKKLPVSVNLSVPTLDEKAWRATEPHTPSPAARLDAVAELRRRGIESGVLIAPLMPGINDDARAGASRSSSGPARPAPPSSAASPSTCAARSATSSSPGSRPNAPTSCPSTNSSTRAAAPTCGPSSASAVTRAVRGWGRSRQCGRGGSPLLRLAALRAALSIRRLRRPPPLPSRTRCSDQLVRAASSLF